MKTDRRAQAHEQSQKCDGLTLNPRRYDEIQTTVVTRAEPHNLRIVHPTQNRVLSIRENARCQVGVSVCVAVVHVPLLWMCF